MRKFAVEDEREKERVSKQVAREEGGTRSERESAKMDEG